MPRPSVEDLLSLIDTFYTLALDDTSWDLALASATRTLAGEAAVFLVEDRTRSELGVARLWGRPDAAMEEYGRDFVGFDVGVDDLLAAGPGSVRTEQDLSPIVRRTNPFLNEFRCRWGIERYMAGAAFCDERRIGVLAIQGARDRRAFAADEIRFFQRLLPHVRRAIRVREEVQGAHAETRVFEELVERVATGVVLLREDRTVGYANAAARRIIRRKDGLDVTRDGLRASSSREDSQLARAITTALALRRAESAQAPEVVRVSRSESARPYEILVGIVPRRESGWDVPYPVVLFVGDPESRLASPLETLQQVYALTPAEARVAASLTSGESLEDFAERVGVAVSTVRWQLKQVQAKTGVRRQVDLVRLLLTGPVAMVRDEGRESEDRD
ncbi:MAG: hypothetical protein R3F16_14190 [Myxococcota bacterium]